MPSSPSVQGWEAPTSDLNVGLLTACHGCAVSFETLYPASQHERCPFRTSPAAFIRPWDCYLLELPDFAEPPEPEELHDFAEDAQSNCETPPESPSYDLPRESFEAQVSADSESHSRALRLIVRLGQPFHAFLIRPSTHTRTTQDLHSQ